MSDDTSDIREFYNTSGDSENGRLERHQLERDMTWRYLYKYLPRQGKILEIGAATGAYTVPLAKRGYEVTAVDFAPNLVAACQQKVREEKLEGKVVCLVADARDLSIVSAKDYAAVLVMGPLYHLVEEEDRRRALQEAFQRLQRRGVIFSTFVSRYGIWGDIITRFPQEIEWPGWLQSVVTRGKQDVPLEYWGKAFRAYFAAPEEIAPLHEKIGFKTIALAGVETGAVPTEVFNNLKGKRRELWLDFLFGISTEKSIVGASCHLLYVGEKE